MNTGFTVLYEGVSPRLLKPRDDWADLDLSIRSQSILHTYSPVLSHYDEEDANFRQHSPLDWMLSHGYSSARFPGVVPVEEETMHILRF